MGAHIDFETDYLASVRVPQGTSLLIGTGSPNHMASDDWWEDHAGEIQRAGLPVPTYEHITKPLVCSSIGHGIQQAEWKVTHSIRLGSRRLGDSSAPELPGAQTPASMGQRSMKKLRTLIDASTGNMYLVWRGGYELPLSLVSEMHNLEGSPVGHTMLPCSRFGRRQ